MSSNTDIYDIVQLPIGVVEKCDTLLELSDEAAALKLIKLISKSERDEKGMTALIYAYYRGFLRKGVELIGISDVNAQDDRGRTALMHAVKFKSHETINPLIAISNLDIQDELGRTASMHSCSNDFIYRRIIRFTRSEIVDNEGRNTIDCAKTFNYQVKDKKHINRSRINVLEIYRLQTSNALEENDIDSENSLMTLCKSLHPAGSK